MRTHYEKEHDHRWRNAVRTKAEKATGTDVRRE